MGLLVSIFKDIKIISIKLVVSFVHFFLPPYLCFVARIICRHSRFITFSFFSATIISLVAFSQFQFEMD
jgi:hypothetical protein